MSTRCAGACLLGILLSAGTAVPTAAASSPASIAAAVAEGDGAPVTATAEIPSRQGDPVEPAQADPGADGSESAARADQTGDDLYCKQRSLGRWFYCERRGADAPADPTGAQAGLTASQRVAAISKRMDELRDRAILDPSEKNMIAFMQFQREQSDRASLMADVFERTLIAHPEMDYNLQRPVSALGKQNWLEQRGQDITQTMLQLKQRYGVFFFFSSRSRPSAVEAPILRSLADNYGLTVVAVSEDGGPSQEFPDYQVDTGQRQNMGLPGKDVPMIALFDTVSHKTTLIATGVVAADDVMQRIFLLTKTEPGKDY